MLSFPFVTDILVMELCIHEARANAILRGDGRAWLARGMHLAYLLAKKGGEAYFHRHGGRAAKKARRGSIATRF